MDSNKNRDIEFKLAGRTTMFLLGAVAQTYLHEGKNYTNVLKEITEICAYLNETERSTVADNINVLLIEGAYNTDINHPVILAREVSNVIKEAKISIKILPNTHILNTDIMPTLHENLLRFYAQHVVLQTLNLMHFTEAEYTTIEANFNTLCATADSSEIRDVTNSLCCYNLEPQFKDLSQKSKQDLFLTIANKIQDIYKYFDNK